MSKPCRCSAYPFPHRALGGKCTHETIFKHYSGFGGGEINQASLYLTEKFCWAPCQYLHEWLEHHGPGLDEPLCECRAQNTEDCPIVQHIIQLSHKKEVA